MTKCRLPEICRHYEISFGIYDVKNERILPRSVNQKKIC